MPRRSPIFAALPALVGCEGLLPYLEEQRADPSVIYWSGPIYDQPYAEDALPFTAGDGEEPLVSVSVTDAEGAALVGPEGAELDAPQEDASEPGYWYLTVPVDTDVVIRLAGEGYASTVWTARTPSGRAYWYTGALFARLAADVTATTDALVEAGILSEAPADLADGQLTHLWIEPYTPEDWVGADFAVSDSEHLAPVLALTADEDGSVRVAGEDDPVYMLFAFDLAPGPVAFEAVTPAGRHVVASWAAEGGDLLHPMFLTFSEEDP